VWNYRLADAVQVMREPTAMEGAPRSGRWSVSGPTYTPPVLPVAAEHALYRDLLRDCAEVLREDIEGCADCNWGKGSTGLSSEGEPCEGCAHHRDLLKRIEAVT
jgi:hypothetical protein